MGRSKQELHPLSFGFKQCPRLTSGAMPRTPLALAVLVTSSHRALFGSSGPPAGGRPVGPVATLAWTDGELPSVNFAAFDRRVANASTKHAAGGQRYYFFKGYFIIHLIFQSKVPLGSRAPALNLRKDSWRKPVFAFFVRSESSRGVWG